MAAARELQRRTRKFILFAAPSTAAGTEREKAALLF
jgi:hypothetical protein